MLTTKMYSGNQDNIINNTGSVSKTMASEIVPENPALKNESLENYLRSKSADKLSVKKPY